MDTAELYKGIVLVVDEKLNTPKEVTDGVGSIIAKLDSKGIPCVKFRELPNDSISHFKNLNFVILDWLLKPIEWEEGELPDGVKNSIFQSNVEFIKKLKNYCFAPVFIFTNEDVDAVKDVLIDGGVYDKDGENFILVKNKKDLIDGENLFNEIESWILSSPSVYVKKVWEQHLYSAKTDAFWHLFERSPQWPKILWESFEKDSVHESANLNEIIFQLVKSRTSLLELDKKVVCERDGQPIQTDDIKQVLIGTMYLGDDKLPPRDIFPGDIYRFDDDRDAYFLNIRPGCDTVIDRAGCDGKLYLLRGTVISAEEMRDQGRYHDEYGFLERIPDVVLYGLDGNDFVRFAFKKLRQLKFNDPKLHRICRLIAPHVSNVQQKYSAYVGRVALPRLPGDSIIPPLPPKTECEDTEKKTSD